MWIASRGVRLLGKLLLHPWIGDVFEKHGDVVEMVGLQAERVFQPRLPESVGADE